MSIKFSQIPANPWKQTETFLPSDLGQYFVNTCVDKPITLCRGDGIIILGDSITQATHGGFTWGSIVAEKLGLAEMNYGVSGSRFDRTFTEHPGNIMQQIARVSEEDWKNGKLVIIAAGTNDAGNDTDFSVYRDSIIEVIETLKAKTDAKLVFITPIKRSDRDFEKLLPKYASILSNLALMNECSVINGYEFPIPTHACPDGFFEDCMDHDGLHPNAYGKKIYAMAVLNALDIHMKD